MSSRRKAQRKLEIAECRRLGEEAFLAGKPRSSNPWKRHESMNSFHWDGAWQAAEEYDRRKKADNQADLDIAIGEHAFDAGWGAALAWARRQHSVVVGGFPSSTVAKHDAWSAYTPPDDLCGGGPA